MCASLWTSWWSAGIVSPHSLSAQSADAKRASHSPAATRPARPQLRPRGVRVLLSRPFTVRRAARAKTRRPRRASWSPRTRVRALFSPLRVPFDPLSVAATSRDTPSGGRIRLSSFRPFAAARLPAVQSAIAEVSASAAASSAAPQDRSTTSSSSSLTARWQRTSVLFPSCPQLSKPREAYAPLSSRPSFAYQVCLSALRIRFAMPSGRADALACEDTGLARPPALRGAH